MIITMNNPKSKFNLLRPEARRQGEEFGGRNKE